MFRRALATLALLPVLLCAPPAAQDCAPTAIVANAKSSNMFSPEQETVFGELWVQNMAGEMRFIRDVSRKLVGATEKMPAACRERAAPRTPAQAAK